MKYETRKKRGKRNARKGLIRGPAEKLMRRCPLLNLARKLLERVAHFSRFPKFLLGTNLCWRKFLARLFWRGKCRLATFKILGQSSYFFSCKLELRDSRRLVKLDSYANRVHDWSEEEDGEKRTKPEPISEIEFTRKFHSPYKGIRVGIDLRCVNWKILLFDASKVKMIFI